MRFLWDTAVFIYALGSSHPYKAPCQRLLGLAEQGALTGEASVELVQEFAHNRRRRGGAPAAVASEARAVARICRLHEFAVADLGVMLSLLERHQRLDARDAVHAATALNRGIPAILTTDRAFDEVPGLQRVDPVNAERVLLS